MPEPIATPPRLGRVQLRTFESLESILDFAIDNEERSINFYVGLAPKMAEPRLKGLLLNFAREEERHQAKLMDVRHAGGKLQPFSGGKIDDLRIADFVPAVAPTAAMDVKDALLVAMNEEKAAFRLYTVLAERAPTADGRTLFQILAQEEAKHKLHLETTYEDLLWQTL